MQTTLTDNPMVAAEFIRAGEIVAFPTETVYGLGANIFSADAIQKIFTAKGRPTDNPLIAHVSRVEDISRITSKITLAAQKLITAFFPGPLTIVLPKHADVPSVATAGLETIGVRMPRHPLAQKFIAACGVPLVAPSANLSGKPSPTTWQTVAADLTGKIACILQGEQTDVGLESTVVDCTAEIPVVLRAGAITLEQLQEIIPATKFVAHDNNQPARSPGLKYRHYSPQARVVIVPNFNAPAITKLCAYIGLHIPVNASSFARVQICQDVTEYARSLFLFFRECDEAGVQEIFCEAVAESGLGLALMDRIKRAAHR